MAMATLTGHRFVSMDTMTMLPMLVRHTAITVRNGLMAESSLVRARGTAMADTGAAGAITDEGTTGAGSTGEAVMPEAATHEAGLNSTVVERAVEASTAEVAAVSMAEAVLTVEGAANQVFR